MNIRTSVIFGELVPEVWYKHDQCWHQELRFVATKSMLDEVCPRGKSKIVGWGLFFHLREVFEKSWQMNDLRVQTGNTPLNNDVNKHTPLCRRQAALHDASGATRPQMECPHFGHNGRSVGRFSPVGQSGYFVIMLERLTDRPYPPWVMTSIDILQ